MQERFITLGYIALSARAVGTRCSRRGNTMLTPRGQDAHVAGISAV